MLRPLEAVIQLGFGSQTTMDTLWAAYEAFFLFWSSGPVPEVISAVIPASMSSNIRLLTDFVITMPASSSGGPVFTKWHRDTTTFDVVDDEYDGYSVWIPLVDIDASVGGSLYVVNKSAIPAECQAFTGLNFSPMCQEELSRHEVVHSWKKGDFLLFGKRTIHRTQPLFGRSSRRSTLIGRFISSDTKYRPVPDDNGPPQKKNSCPEFNDLVPGGPFQSYCFPQVFPTTLPNEINEIQQGTGHKCNDWCLAAQIWGFLTATEYY